MSQTSIQPALEAFQQGRHQEAASWLTTLLQQEPTHAQAMHLMGIVLAHLGRLGEALGWIDQALSLAPQSAEAHMDRGNIFLSQNNPTTAIDCYRQAVSLQPSLVQAHVNLGQALRLIGDSQRAVESLETAVRLKPDLVSAWFYLGFSKFDLGDFQGALVAYVRTLALQPNHIRALINKGITLVSMRRFQESLTVFATALKVDPESAEAMTNLGNALVQLDRADEAIYLLDEGLKRKPDEPYWLTWKGHALQQQKKFEESLSWYEQALRVAPTLPWAIEGIGVALHELERFEEAIPWLDRVIELAPNSATTYLNRGNTLRELGRYQAAIKDFSRACDIDPQYGEPHFNLAVVYLKTGDWQKGWPLYEWRWRYKQAPDPSMQPLGLPRWDGQAPLQGRKILVSHEQGLGDSLQSLRYTAPLAELGAEVWVWVPPALERIARRAPAVTGVIVSGKNRAPEGFDYSCPLMSLPGIFSPTPEHIPSRDRAYLFSDPALTDKWRQKISVSRGRPVVGLMWRGHANRFLPGRSMDLPTLDPILSTGSAFVSLQKDLNAEDLAAVSERAIQHFGLAQQDFADAAAIIECCDVVITIDTSIAHLAGSLGKETWIMLPYAADWRWLEHRSDSIWYPRARLFRQQQRGQWGEVVNRIADALRAGEWRK